MKRTLVMLFALLVAGSVALAQVEVRPGTPEEVAAAVAEAPGTWADEAVTMLVERGLYIGYPDGTYRWREYTTRAELAMVIARLIKSFDLEQFDPNEIALLRNLVDRLDNELGSLRDLVLAQDGDLRAAAEAIGRNEAEIEDLWAALEALDTAPVLFDASDLWNAISALDADQTATRADVDALAARVAALEAAGSSASADELTALDARVAGLTDRLAAVEAVAAANESELASLRSKVDALADDVVASSELAAALQEKLAALSARVDALEAAQADLEAALEDVNGRLDDHEARIARLESKLLPDRAPFYVALAVYGSDPDEGLIGQVMVGHDAVIDNLGVRVSVDFGFDRVPLSVAGDVTYRATQGVIDGYAGIGGGAQFKDTETVVFGEILLGVQWRVFRNVALFGEGRYRPYFNGTGDHQPAIFGGVQIRF